MSVRRVAGVVAALALATTGAYLLLYLFRWEWHRAIVAGILFVATEVALMAGVVLRRLSALDRRLDQLDERGRTTPGAVLARIQAAAPPPRNHFAWLQVDRFDVFLPILLGAGVLASALAWVVESLSRATARPVLEQGLASRLTALSLPDGGLLGPFPSSSSRGPARSASPLHPGRRRRYLAWGAVLLVAAATGAGGIDALADASQSRPDRTRPGVSTAIDLRLAGARAAREPETAARHLWGACTSVLGRGTALSRIYELEDGEVRVEVGTDLGLHARRRLRGCLEDAAVDRIQARVLAVTAHAGLGPTDAP